MTRELILVLDELDHEIIQKEIAERQAIDNRQFGETIVPEGESNLAGAMLAEVVRDLRGRRFREDGDERMIEREE